jgi:arylsulfatase A
MQGIEEQYGPDIHNDFVIDFIRKNQRKPFLAYYPMSLVHGPFERTPDSKNAGRERGPQFYPDMVAYMDKLLGKVFGVLDELKLREKTLILFSGDNGTPRQITSKAGDKTIPGGKGTMADTGSHVPLIAHWPGVSAAGRTCDDLINFTDFLPTLAEASGAKVPEDRPIDGRSFLPQIRGEKGKPREWSLIELNEKRFVLSGNYKLNQNGNLFDLSDPMEEKLIEPAKESKEAAAMRKKLTDLLTSIPRGKKESGNAAE